MKKVAILTTGHPPLDDRIFYKISHSLIKFGYHVKIICTTQQGEWTQDNIEIKGILFNNLKNPLIKKLQFFVNELKLFHPEIVICSEPLPVIFSYVYKITIKYKVKIIYDITEWYPENIANKKYGLIKYLTILFGHIINFLATNFSSYLFIGEEWKLKRYRLYSPKKNFSIISYYPVLEYYNFSPPNLLTNEIIFGYAGVISVSRGLEIFYRLMKTLRNRLPLSQKITFVLAGRFETEEEKEYLEKFNSININFEYHQWTDYKSFSKILENVHICLDIRPRNGIYERSLPIKIFDYMALGKCIIASNYEPIKNIFDIARFGVLVDPENFYDIVENTINLISHPHKIQEAGINGRKAVEKIFNWNVCEQEIKKVLETLNDSE